MKKETVGTQQGGNEIVPSEKKHRDNIIPTISKEDFAQKTSRPIRNYSHTFMHEPAYSDVSINRPVCFYA